MPDTPKVAIPATLNEAADQLGAIDRLLMARAWERAAIVAAFVRPGGTTAEDFAALGIRGLRKPATVRLYADRWLDLGLGHPEPGETVALPETDWEPTRTGTDGHSSPEGAAETVRRIAQRHPEAVHRAAAELDAEAAEADRRRLYADKGWSAPEPGAPAARANAFHELAVHMGDARYRLRRFARGWEAQASDPDPAYRLDADGTRILLRDLADVIAKAELLRLALQGAPADLSDLLAEEGGR